MPKRPDSSLPENAKLKRRIGCMLKVGREVADLSQTEAARLMGLGHRSTIAKYETGERETTPALLCRFGRLYGTPPGSYLEAACSTTDADELEILVRSEIQFVALLIEYAEHIKDPVERKRIVKGLEMSAKKQGYEPPLWAEINDDGYAQ